MRRLVTATLAAAAICQTEIVPERLRHDCQSDTDDDAASENEFSAKVVHTAVLLFSNLVYGFDDIIIVVVAERNVCVRAALG
mgnify:CR=1 FL=1